MPEDPNRNYMFLLSIYEAMETAKRFFCKYSKFLQGNYKPRQVNFEAWGDPLP